MSCAAVQAWMNISIPSIKPGKESKNLVNNAINMIIAKYFGTPEVYSILRSLKGYLEQKSPGTIVTADTIADGNLSYFNGCVIVPGVFLKACKYLFSTAQADVAFMKGIKSRPKEGKSWLMTFKDGANSIHLGLVGHLGNENKDFATYFFNMYKQHIHPLLDEDRNILIDMGKGLIAGITGTNLKDIMGHCTKHFAAWVKKYFCTKDNVEALDIFWSGVNAYTETQLQHVRARAKEFDLKNEGKNFGVKSTLEGKLLTYKSFRFS
jgi:hypothetical protein